MNTKSTSKKLMLTACLHIATLVTTIAFVIIGPVACSGLAVIYKWQDRTQDATFYLALLAVFLVSKDDLIDAYERSYNKYIKLYRSEHPEEKE
jgi:hypothetical protein